MTYEKIIKAIKACVEIEDCSQCPYKNNNLLDTSCFSKLFKETLDLINHQRAEIERLKKIGTEADNFARAICNERMLKGKPVADYEDLQEYIKKAKAEAIKEFAERLKEESSIECDVSMGFGRPCYEDAIPIIAVDNLVKEMVGDEND